MAALGCTIAGWAMAESTPEKTQLTSWKEVAAFFNATPRTVMRWERERGLPIRRLPGDARSRVYADVAELEAWLALAAPSAVMDAAAATPPPAAPEVKNRIDLTWIIGLVAVVLAIVVAAIMSLERAPGAALSAEAQTAFDTANQNFDRRTPAALAAAIEGFTRVTRLVPGAAEGFSGLASAYAIAPEYTAMTAAEAYGKAADFARRAIARDKRNARAWATLGFARYYGALDRKEADAAFARAVALDPENTQVRHWRATFFLATGRVSQALSEIDAALALDPASPSIAADRALILGHLGRVDEAKRILEGLTAQSPDFRSPRAYLADIAFMTGDDEAFVRESAARARLQNDLYGVQLAEAARAGLLSGGRSGMLKAMLAVRLHHFGSGRGGALEIARLHLLLGDREEARRYVNLAIARREPEVAYIDLYPDLKGLRDPDES